MQTFIMTIGVPGSGKSTKIDKSPLSGYVVISPDLIRKEVTGRVEDVSQDRRVWEIVYDRIAATLRSGVNVVLDATGANADHRRKMTRFAAENAPGDLSIEAWVFDISLNAALKRNQNRDRQVPEAVIRRMAKALWADPPSFEDGFHRLTFINEDGTTRHFEDAA